MITAPLSFETFIVYECLTTNFLTPNFVISANYVDDTTKLFFRYYPTCKVDLVWTSLFLFFNAAWVQWDRFTMRMRLLSLVNAIWNTSWSRRRLSFMMAISVNYLTDNQLQCQMSLKLDLSRIKYRSVENHTFIKKICCDPNIFKCSRRSCTIW